MKLLLISDTHGVEPKLEEADVLVHAGDLTMSGTVDQMLDSLDWLGKERHKFEHVVLIAGNHDFIAEDDPESMAKWCLRRDLTYLNDSGVTIDGVKFWGSPVQPWFHDWAFNRARGNHISKHWDLIPDDTDVLITHGPPHGVLDRTMGGDIVGCEELWTALLRAKPHIHVFGHIHEGYGERSSELQPVTRFINASHMNYRYWPENKPVLIEI